MSKGEMYLFCKLMPQILSYNLTFYTFKSISTHVDLDSAFNTIYTNRIWPNLVFLAENRQVTAIFKCVVGQIIVFHVIIINCPSFQLLKRILKISNTVFVKEFVFQASCNIGKNSTTSQIFVDKLYVFLEEFKVVDICFGPPS